MPGQSDGEQAPLSQFAQLVKANRGVQIGHTLLGAKRVHACDMVEECRRTVNSLPMTLCMRA